MSQIFDCRLDGERAQGLDLARRALQHGELAVIPTDTVYGVAADAFDPAAVAALLAAKGRTRQKPPPVLIGSPEALDGLAVDVPDEVRAAVSRFWPGGLTVILRAQPSLSWDLGDTYGTVALRMPDDELALELLRGTGPLAVSSANLTGQPPAATAAEAQDQLGARVEIYLEHGPAAGGVPSTIVDATGDGFRVVRAGALPAETLAEVLPGLVPAAAPADPADQGDEPKQ